MVPLSDRIASADGEDAGVRDTPASPAAANRRRISGLAATSERGAPATLRAVRRLLGTCAT